MVWNLFAALLFRASIHRTLAGSCGGCGRENSRWRDGDRRPSLVSALSHLFVASTRSEWAMELRGFTARISHTSSGVFTGGLACRRACGEWENDPDSDRKS